MTIYARIPPTPTPAAANHKAERWNGPIETTTDALHPTAHISECPEHRQYLDPPDSRET